MKYKKALIIVLLVLIFGGYYSISKFKYPLKYNDSIKTYSREYNVSPHLVAAIINYESGFKELNSYVEGGKNGIVQLKDYTAIEWADKMGIKEFKDRDLMKTDLNIKMATWYLSENYDKKDEDKAIRKWVNKNVREDKNNKLTEDEVKAAMDFIKSRERIYKIFHPLCGK